MTDLPVGGRAALPPSITDALSDTRGEQIRRAADALAWMMSQMHSGPCHVKIEDDFAFVLILRDFREEVT